LTTNELAKTIQDELDFYTTFGWHPLGVEAALGTLAYWREHRGTLLQNVTERSSELRHRLSIMDFAADNVELRVQGLAVGVGLGDEDYVHAIEKECRGQGLLLFAEGESLVMFPALTIDHETLDEGLAILAQAVRR
jgi:putrescine aminotransferase